MFIKQKLQVIKEKDGEWGKVRVQSQCQRLILCLILIFFFQLLAILVVWNIRAVQISIMLVAKVFIGPRILREETVRTVQMPAFLIAIMT